MARRMAASPACIACTRVIDPLPWRVPGTDPAWRKSILK